jgi:hypothetical protein
MDPGNAGLTGGSGGSSVNTKGTHRGRRKGAGRPRKPLIAKVQTLGASTAAPLPPPVQARVPAVALASTSSRQPTAAFFLPYTTHRPVPLGNFTAPPTVGRASSSFWSAGGASRSEVVPVTVQNAALGIKHEYLVHLFVLTSPLSPNLTGRVCTA